MDTLAKLKSICLIIFLVGLPSFVSAQEMGAAADSPSPGHFSLQFSYENPSREFILDGYTEKIRQKILKAKLGFRPNRYWNLYGFAGGSNFPNSFADDQTQLYFGGGLKLLMIGEVEVEEEDKTTINISAGMGLDFQISRLQSSGNQAYDSFGLTKYQGALDLSVRVFGFAGYLGFKMSKLSGNFTPIGNSTLEVNSKGLCSLFLGLNVHVNRFCSLVSEFSFFSEKSWALGLRFDL